MENEPKVSYFEKCKELMFEVRNKVYDSCGTIIFSERDWTPESISTSRTLLFSMVNNEAPLFRIGVTFEKVEVPLNEEEVSVLNNLARALLAVKTLEGKQHTEALALEEERQLLIKKVETLAKF